MAYVSILDDDPAVLDSLEIRLTAEGFQTTGFLDPEDFLAQKNFSQFDCCLVDVHLPKMSGTQVMRETLRRDPSLPVIVISGHGDIEDAVYAVKQGATGYLEKPINGEKLISQIRMAVQMRSESHLQNAKVKDYQARIASLTPREREVFNELLLGHANKVIAHTIGCSQRTVEIHRSRVMSKTQASNLAELIHLATAAGI